MENPDQRAYLIVARYHHDSWKNEVKKGEEGKPTATAQNLFPDGEQRRPLPHPEGVLVVRTFISNIFTALPPDFETKSREEKDRILDDFDQRGEIDVGWMAVIGERHFWRFMSEMVGREAHLWRMYKIGLHTVDATWDLEEIRERFGIPKLNDDETTHDIYVHMSPVHWGHRKT